MAGSGTGAGSGAGVGLTRGLGLDPHQAGGVGRARWGRAKCVELMMEVTATLNKILLLHIHLNFII